MMRNKLSILMLLPLMVAAVYAQADDTAPDKPVPATIVPITQEVKTTPATIVPTEKTEITPARIVPITQEVKTTPVKIVPTEPEVVPTPTAAPSDSQETPIIKPENASKVDAATTKPSVAEVGMKMNFQDAPLSAVLKAMSESLGLTIIDQARVSGRVTIMSRKALTTNGAIAALNAALKANGLTAVKGANNMLRIIQINNAKTASIPVRNGADPEAIKLSDEMITQVIPVRYADAKKLTADVADLIPSYAHLTSNEASNTLIYTASEADVRHLVEIISSLDKNQGAVNQVKVFAMKYAEADDVAELLEDIFSSDSNSSSKNNKNIRGMRFGPPGMMGMGRNNNSTTDSDSGTKQAKVTAAADKETNSVVVSAPKEIMTMISTVIEQLDVDPTVEEVVFTYPLSYATAKDLAEVLTEILKEDSSSSSSDEQRTRGQNRMFGPPGMNNNNTSSSTSSSDLAGNVTVTADKNTNSLLVRTAPKYVERTKKLIAELDRPVRQVLIKVLIAEVTLDDSLDLGAEFSVLDITMGKDGKGSIGTNFNLATETTGMIASYTNVHFEATLRALESVGKLDILSRPYLLGCENQEASITVGEEVPYITNSRVTEAGQTVNTVDYRDIGIILGITPYVGPDGMVMLDVSQEISSRTGKTVVVSEDFTAEVYNKREVTTRVVVNNGGTVVIGGLIQNSLTDTITKVPFFGDLPWIGAAFRRTETTKTKTELLLFLSPQTALTPAELEKITKKVKKQAETLPNAVEPGEFEKAYKEIGDTSPTDVIPLDELTPIVPAQKKKVTEKKASR